MKRLYIYKCQCRIWTSGKEGELFHFGWTPPGKGPRPYPGPQTCYLEPGCSGPVEFVGVYVPEGSG